MDRLFFSIPRERYAYPDSLLYQVIKLPRHPNIRQARRVYKVLRNQYSAQDARWMVYDIMSIRTELAGKGYGL